MWDTVQTNELHLSHDLPCPRCRHAAHSYLACSDTCDCPPTVMPGTVALAEYAADTSFTTNLLGQTDSARKTGISRLVLV